MNLFSMSCCFCNRVMVEKRYMSVCHHCLASYNSYGYFLHTFIDSNLYCLFLGSILKSPDSHLLWKIKNTEMFENEWENIINECFEWEMVSALPPDIIKNVTPGNINSKIKTYLIFQ